MDSTLKRFSELGLPLQITELDVSIHAKEHQTRQRRAGERDTAFTAAKAERQAEQYKMIFAMFRKHSKHITSVTFWNISDRHSWLDNFPVSGRKDYPLLFDVNLQPKKAYRDVIRW